MNLEFGEYIRSLREKKGMTLEMLSEESGVSVSQISRIESGKRGIPKPPTIKKLAAALNVSYTEMMIVAGHYEEEDLAMPMVNESRGNYKTNPASSAEARFDKALNEIELSDEELLKQFAVKLDGRELTEEEARGVIAYLRIHRQSQ